MKLEMITRENVFSTLAGEKKPWHGNYLAMYSTQWPGVTKDPCLMTIPIDDHLVHRGDGVFDVMRCVRGRVYQMEMHLRRFEKSAEAVSLDFPPEYKYIRDLIKKLIVLGAEKECLIRVLLSRGPGSFSPNPFDCPSSQLNININRFHPLPESAYKEGVRLVTSTVPIKKEYFANIKSCDYLPNVMMKMEALKSGCDYAVALDEDGFLAEGAIENIGIVTKEGVLKFPGFDRTLSGVTVTRVFHLGKELVNDGTIKDVRFDKITRNEAYASEEIFLTGTSLNILPVVTYDEHTIGAGSPGLVFKRLASLLWRDMTENDEALTEIDWEEGMKIS
jgi:branched-chain amino acid aminotransferase